MKQVHGPRPATGPVPPKVYLGPMWRLLIAIGLLLDSLTSAAQCGPCAWGDTCIVDPPFPTVCPAIPPTAFVGVPYSVDVTFWVPPSFPEPTTQLNVVLNEVVLDAIENIPAGLTYEASNPDLIYQPQLNPFGCVRVCGIPVIAGPDTLRIHVTANGTVGGIQTSRPYVLSLPIAVQGWPADSLTGFAFMPDSSCAPAEVLFTTDSSLAVGVSSAFAWDFGNGSAFGGQFPPAQVYDEGGTYEVSFSRLFAAPVLVSLSLSGVSGAWCGDLDEPNLPIVGCVGQPDLYFTITDSRLGLERSTTLSNTQSGTWSSQSIVLGFPPFVLRIYDSDALTADDLLGTFGFDGAAGSYPFSASGTSGTLVVQTQTLLNLTTTDSVHVLPVPEIVLSFDPVSGLLCVENDSLLSYAWSLDGNPVPDETGSCVNGQNGLWTVFVTDEYSCSSSASYLITGVGVAELPAPRDRLSVQVLPGLLVRVDHLGKRSPCRLSVFEASGRAVLSERLSLSANGRTWVQLPALVEGFYTAVITDGESRSTCAFVVAP